MQSARGKDYGKLRKKGLSPDFEAKLDMMFMSITTTGTDAYSPASSLPLPRSPVECDNAVDLKEGSGDFDEVLEQQTSKRKGRERVEKGMPPKREKVRGSAYMSRQINRMVDVLESTSTSIKSARPPTCASIMEVMKEVPLLLGMVVGSPLFMFTTELFSNADKREMFGSLEDPNLKMDWIKYQHAKYCSS